MSFSKHTLGFFRLTRFDIELACIVEKQHARHRIPHLGASLKGLANLDESPGTILVMSPPLVVACEPKTDVARRVWIYVVGTTRLRHLGESLLETIDDLLLLFIGERWPFLRGQ